MALLRTRLYTACCLSGTIEDTVVHGLLLLGIVEDAVMHGFLLPGSVKDTLGHSLDKMKTQFLHGWVDI